MEEIYDYITSFQKEDQNNILFYLGGVLNHNLYWQSINPNQKEFLQGNLKDAVDQKFGSFDHFKRNWIENAMDLKGSGYVFLVKTPKGEVEIITTQNQDSPLQFGYIPLFCIDMWEHAYYLNYKNEKKNYIDNFFQLANFRYANQKYNEKI